MLHDLPQLWSRRSSQSCPTIVYVDVTTPWQSKHNLPSGSSVRLWSVFPLSVELLCRWSWTKPVNWYNDGRAIRAGGITNEGLPLEL